jgi:hypothetical protein
MRKILITLAVLVVLLIGAGLLWVSAGRQISLFLDKSRTIQAESQRIRSLRYEGNGTGGILRVNQIALSLNDPVAPLQAPSVGSTRDRQLGLAAGGKVFPFGPMPAETNDNEEVLATSSPAGDDARITLRHSVLSWPTPINFNFMSGLAPSWKRHQYYHLRWIKPSGSKLEMLWRYEQYFYPSSGWSPALMTRANTTGLIQIDIQN